MTDQERIDEYNKEVFGKYYSERVSESHFTVEKLIEQSCAHRKQNSEAGKIYKNAFTEGLKNGYEFAKKEAAENTIMLQDLRNMTFQQIANLIGTDD
jgi:hypothetical protein